MNNVLISFVYLVLSFTATIFLYKNYGKFGLYCWMCVLVVICNIQTVKLTEVFNLNISLGNISYGALFLTTDILSEKYGRQSANKATKISFIIMILFAFFMTLFLNYKPSVSDFSQDAFETIFKYIPRITVGSLLAYYVSQRCDAYLYSVLKAKYNKIWISNSLSTIFSQLVDTFIFVLIAFAGIMKINALIGLAVTMILFKIMIAILDTPFMILVMKIKKVKEVM